MAQNDILRGAGGLPLYGKDGTILYSTQITMSVSITVSWSDGNDLDLCAFYSHRTGAKMGYSYSSNVANDGDGFTASWGGDNTTGGPETLSLAYSGARGIAGKRFEIHLNWYNPGTGNSGGAATVTATDAKGNSLSYSIMPAHTKSQAAAPNSPGVAIVFNNDGTLGAIEAA